MTGKKFEVSLVSIFIDVMLEEFETMGDVALKISEHTGMELKKNRLYDWRLGKHTPPAKVIKFMLEKIFEAVLEKYNILSSTEMIKRPILKKIIKDLCPPEFNPKLRDKKN